MAWVTTNLMVFGNPPFSRFFSRLTVSRFTIINLMVFGNASLFEVLGLEGICCKLVANHTPNVQRIGRTSQQATMRKKRSRSRLDRLPFHGE